MAVGIITHHDCLAHDTGLGHPERADRLRAILGLREQSPYDALDWIDARPATTTELARAHGQGYVERMLAAIPDDGSVLLDGDTVISPGSGRAALLAAGAGCQAVDLVQAGTLTRAFCAVRPPGHHAEITRPMGFCLFSSIAVAALHALEAHGLSRVAIVDFDVHHGNGTQDVLWSDARVLFCSSHESPLFPGTGMAHERGAHGNILNVPLPAQSDRTSFEAAYRDQIFPTVDQFAPELLLVSAGFDAHLRDPLASLRLTTEDFSWISAELVALANRHCGGRMVSMLEGGYDLTGLRDSVAAHLDALNA